MDKLPQYLPFSLWKPMNKVVIKDKNPRIVITNLFYANTTYSPCSDEITIREDHLNMYKIVLRHELAHRLIYKIFNFKYCEKYLVINIINEIVHLHWDVSTCLFLNKMKTLRMKAIKFYLKTSKRNIKQMIHISLNTLR